jgi:Ulp1 family protease
MSNPVNESRLCDDRELEISEEDLEYYKSLCDKNVINDSIIDLYSEEIKNISQEDIDNSDNPAETHFYLELIKNSDNPSEIEFYLECIKTSINTIKNNEEHHK